MSLIIFGGRHDEELSVVVLALCAAMLSASDMSAAPCLTVTLTGHAGRAAGLPRPAGAGTLVRYGDDADNCDALRLQFDAGRGTLHAAVADRR